MSRDVPLSYGVDFERALERLHHDTGAAIRCPLCDSTQRRATGLVRLPDGNVAAEYRCDNCGEVWTWTDAAQARAEQLRVHDHDAIAQILARSHRS